MGIALLFENEKKISEKCFSRKPIALLFENEKKKKIPEKGFLKKPIALLFENEKEKNENPQNLRKRTLWHSDPRPRSFFHIFGGFEKSAIFFYVKIKITEKCFLRKPIALLFENEKQK